MANIGSLPNQWCKNAKIMMIQRGITYEQLSERTGYSREYLANVLNGKKKPDKAIKSISYYLGISDDYPGTESIIKD